MRKKDVTRLRFSVASTQYAKPPSNSKESSPNEALNVGSLVSVDILDTPRKGVLFGEGSALFQSLPSHGSLRLISSLFKEMFHPVAMLQKRSMRKMFQNTRRLLSISVQSRLRGRNAARLMRTWKFFDSCSSPSSSTLSCKYSTVRDILPTIDQADGPRPVPIHKVC